MAYEFGDSFKAIIIAVTPRSDVSSGSQASYEEFQLVFSTPKVSLRYWNGMRPFGGRRAAHWVEATPVIVVDDEEEDSPPDAEGTIDVMSMSAGSANQTVAAATTSRQGISGVRLHSMAAGVFLEVGCFVQHYVQGKLIKASITRYSSTMTNGVNQQFVYQ